MRIAVFGSDLALRKFVRRFGSGGGTDSASGNADESRRPIRTARGRRSRRRRTRLRSIVVAVAAIAVATVIRSWVSRQPNGRLSEQRLELSKNALLRPAYPYSIVPGGVYSTEDFDAAVVRDSVVAAHYDTFSSVRLRPIRLASSRAAYVSYRVNNAIYWSKRPVRLIAGEQLLTDGEHVLRSRCGNRVSHVPRFPIRRYDPPPITGEQIEPGPGPPMIPARFEVDITLVLAPPVRLEPVRPLDKPPAETFWPLDSGGFSAPPFTSTPPVAIVPEPESVALLGSVLLLIAATLLRRTRIKRFPPRGDPNTPARPLPLPPL